jgi:hypothetical protein
VCASERTFRHSCRDPCHGASRCGDQRNSACIVAELFVERDYGFLKAATGEEIYFYRGSLSGAAFDRPTIGDRMRYVFDSEEGDNGPRANAVIQLGGGGDRASDARRPVERVQSAGFHHVAQVPVQLLDHVRRVAVRRDTNRGGIPRGEQRGGLAQAIRGRPVVMHCLVRRSGENLVQHGCFHIATFAHR